MYKTCAYHLEFLLYIYGQTTFRQHKLLLYHSCAYVWRKKQNFILKTTIFRVWLLGITFLTSLSSSCTFVKFNSELLEKRPCSWILQQCQLLLNFLTAYTLSSSHNRKYFTDWPCLHGWMRGSRKVMVRLEWDERKGQGG